MVKKQVRKLNKKMKRRVPGYALFIGVVVLVTAIKFFVSCSYFFWGERYSPFACPHPSVAIIHPKTSHSLTCIPPPNQTQPSCYETPKPCAPHEASQHD